MVIETVAPVIAITSLVILSFYASYKVRKEKRDALIKYWEELQFKTKKETLKNDETSTRE